MKQISKFMEDARHGQIVALLGLISLGIWAFSFEMPWWRPVVAVATANAVQLVIARLMGFRYDWRSPTISSMSLTLLLRTNGPELVAFAALVAIASKSVFRVQGRHFFNPTGLGIVVAVALFDGAWISPGQWGAAGWAVLFATGAGLAVTYGASRLDVPLSFLGFWAALAMGWALWLGDPLAIPLHQLSSGALVVFAFFMISDPMTVPWNRWARFAWVGAVAVTGFVLQTSWIVASGPIWGLVVLAPLVPVLNAVFPAPAARWRPSPQKGVSSCVTS